MKSKVISRLFRSWLFMLLLFCLDWDIYINRVVEALKLSRCRRP